MKVIIYSKVAEKTADEERNRKFKEKYGREMNYEDIILSFGGRFVGQSQDTGRRGFTGSQDEGIV